MLLLVLNLIQCLGHVIITECCSMLKMSLQSRDYQYGMKDVVNWMTV